MSRSGLVVTLLTDFGLSDAYAGVLKGVILSLAPAARIVDLTHDVPPQSVLSGAFLLETACRYFPQGSVHLVVVDPGVGTPRGRIALHSAGHYFVGPDNGLLSAALPDEARGRRGTQETYEARSALLPDGVRAVAIKPPAEGRPVSATFEGRDVFAPAAARLAAGAALTDLGRAVGEALVMPALRAPAEPNGGLHGLVIHVDHFGNAITDVLGSDLPPEPVFEAVGLRLHLRHTYADDTGPVAIVSSAGRVEIAIPGDNAARELGLKPGDPVLVRPAP